MEKKYTQVGAGWKKDGRIVIKLNDGKWMTVFKNQRKQRDNHPDFNITMATEDADAMGLNIKYDKSQQSDNATQSNQEEEIDISEVEEEIENNSNEENIDDVKF